jgi:hypothetical protein
MTGERLTCSFRNLFGLAFKRRNLPVALPKFNIVTINKLLCLFHGLAVIGAFQWNNV